MFRKATILGIFCLIGTVHAQQITMGIVGFTRVQKPAQGLNLVGNNFGDGSSTLNEITPVDQFSGSFLIGNADKIYVWDASIPNYVVYALYESGPTKEWRNANSFYGSAVDPVIPAGSAFWLQSSGSSTNDSLFVTGDVVGQQFMTNQVVSGLQLLAYPFTSDINLNAASLKDNATGSFLIGNADKIYTWDLSTTNYAVYALYESGSTKEWRDANSFYSPAGAADVQLGQGFWYEAKSDFTWVESNKYFNNL